MRMERRKKTIKGVESFLTVLRLSTDKMLLYKLQSGDESAMNEGIQCCWLGAISCPFVNNWLWPSSVLGWDFTRTGMGHKLPIYSSPGYMKIRYVLVAYFLTD